MDTNYYQTFITVAEDCLSERGVVPPLRGGMPTKAGLEYELAANHPYRYTSDELLIEAHLRHRELSGSDLAQEGEALRAAFIAKSQPCLRASMLPKKFGWGIHFDEAGKLALYPVESEEYQAFASGERAGVKLIRAMRNKSREL